MTVEIWKPIPGFGGHYEASSLGNVRVKERVIVKPHSQSGAPCRYTYGARQLKLIPNGKGYFYVHIGVDGKKTKLQAHRAVLLAFVGPPPAGHEACHRNGQSGDNRVENLRWDTHFNNNQDRVAHGTYATGEAHPMAKITAEVALEIYRSNERGRVLAKRYGICETKISSIRLGRTWKSVTGGAPRPEINKSGPDRKRP